MPRKSATELALNAVIPLRIDNRPEPPADIPALQQEFWRAIVASKPADWFDAGSLPLLRALVGHIATLEQIEIQFAAPLNLSEDGLSILDKLSRLRDRESRALASLSTKLRLTIQSRYTPQSAATAARGGGTRKPWEIVAGGKQ